MSSIAEEIQQLQLNELEKQKKEKEGNDKKTSINYNFGVINNLLNEKKTKIANNKYSKSIPLAKYYDEQRV